MRIGRSVILMIIAEFGSATTLHWRTWQMLGCNARMVCYNMTYAFAVMPSTQEIDTS